MESKSELQDNMKTYNVRIVGNDGFDRVTPVQADSIEELVKERLTPLLEWHGRTTIEQFIRVDIKLDE